MKTVLIFGDDESDARQAAIDGAAWKAVCWDLDQWLRGQVKYSGKEDLDAARTALNDLIRDAGLNLDDG